MTDAPKIDTQAPDTSREAVERLASFHEGVARSWNDHIRGAYPVSHKGHAVVAATLRALLAERDLADARAAAAWLAGRDAAATEAERGCETAPLRDSGLMQAIANNIRDLTPPTDTAALDRLIAERVREAVEAEREACAQILAEMALAYDKADDQGRPVALMVARNAIAARGSKEGRDG